MESGRLSLDEWVGQIDPRFAGLRHVTVGDVLGFRVSLQTPGRIDAAPSREAGLSRLFAMSVCPTPAIRVYSEDVYKRPRCTSSRPLPRAAAPAGTARRSGG